MPSLIETQRDGAVARIWLNRPDQHNALSPELGSELASTLHDLAHDDAVRVVVLGGHGPSFCAGADIGTMKASAHLSFEENLAEAEKLARMFAALGDFPKPLVGRVQGNVFGGGVGLVCGCDIAVAAEDARFGITEVRLGILPAVISPYVIAAMGQRNARRYFLTAERFDAQEALRIGLVHTVVDPAQLDATLTQMIDELLKGGPHAIAEAKDLIASVSNRPVDQALAEDTAARIARIRVSSEGQEGTNAFLEKRAPGWTKPRA